MQKSAPSISKILIAAGFALSCFGLLLFLWVAFGGPVPLKSKSYRVKSYTPEAIQLAIESDVRIGGVSVGKVKSIDLAPPEKRLNGQDLTEFEIEIEPEFAPLSSDARLILRSKTLLGETYIEVTSGSGDAAISLGDSANNTPEQEAGVTPVPEDGWIGVDPATGEPDPALIQEQTQIDEIFNALDDETRRSFQRWLQNSAVAIQGRGLDLNDALGNLGPFLDDASEVVSTLRAQKRALKGLVRNTGIVFSELTENEEALRGAIVNSNDAFDALASEETALKEVVQILPTFQRETRATLERLDSFQANTLPLVQDLQPVADDISPTLRSVRQLSPRLNSLFGDLDDLVRVSKQGLPDLEDFVDGAGPVLESLDPFLANLNPVINYLNYYRTSLTDFISNPPAGLSGTLTPEPGQPAARHALRQLGYITQESLAIYPERIAQNRGNGYLPPLDRVFADGEAGLYGSLPDFDCSHVGGERIPGDGGTPATGVGFAPCFLAPDFPGRFGGTQGPQLPADGSP